MQIAPLENENIYAHYDPIKKMVMVNYRKKLTPDVTHTFYQWMLNNLMPYREQIRGSIYDFREVRQFDQKNISASQQESRDLNRTASLDHIAAISIVGNVYQRQMIEMLNKMSPGAERKTIVNTYQEAFAFMRDWDQKQGRTPHPEQRDGIILDSDNATAYINENNYYGHIFYYGVLDATTTATVYQTLGHQSAHYGFTRIRGGVFDFRHVTKFDNSNTRAVARSSTELVSARDMSRMPVALIVDTMMQERMVITGMKVTPDERRKRIVKSWSEALDYLAEYHKRLDTQETQQASPEEGER